MPDTENSQIDDLQSRLVSATDAALDISILALIEKMLLGYDGNGKIPFTVKYEFSKGMDGQIDVKITSKCSLGIEPINISVSTDGDQLALGIDGDASEPPVPLQHDPDDGIAEGAASLYDDGLIARDTALRFGD